MTNWAELNPHLDDQDLRILAGLAADFDSEPGPRHGDLIVMRNGETRRIAHAWNDFIQPTLWAESGSWYLGRRPSFSGGLDGSIPRELFRLSENSPTPKNFWFFHHDLPGAGRGITVSVPVRVWYCDYEYQKRGKLAEMAN
jgi:hypothetical protein